MVISIENAEYLKDYLIKLTFSDGTIQTIDFSTFLKGARNPMTRKYLDRNLFSDFTIDHGDIVWNEYELCFPIWDLYEGRI